MFIFQLINARFFTRHVSKRIFACSTLFFITLSAYAINTQESIAIEKHYHDLAPQISASSPTTTWIVAPKFIDCLHYLKLEKWEACLSSLNSMRVSNNLEYNNFRNYLYGVTYHRLGESQKAFNHYKLVPYSSKYYIHANFNIALLHLDLGRPSKAIRIINNLIKSDTVAITPEMRNKLLLVVGYIYFLNKDFDNSHIALKSVSIDSQYYNNAIAALALGYIYSADFETARSYLSYLSRLSMKDGPADAAYIFLAFAHSQERSFSEETVTAYKNAIDYYTKRIDQIDRLLNTSSELPLVSSYASDHLFIVENNILDLSNQLPESFLANFASLDTLTYTLNDSGSGETLHQQAQNLRADYAKTTLMVARQRLSSRRDSLAKYLHQCMYTMARILYQNKL